MSKKPGSKQVDIEQFRTDNEVPLTESKRERNPIRKHVIVDCSIKRNLKPDLPPPITRRKK